MTRKAILRAALVFALLAAVYLAVQTAFVSVPRPKAPAPAAQPPAPLALPEARQEPAAVPGDEGRRTGKLALEDKSREVSGHSTAASEGFSDSIRKKNTERAVLPGVTINSAREVNVKLANKDERIQIRREPGNSNSDYQVLWQKQY